MSRAPGQGRSVRAPVEPPLSPFLRAGTGLDEWRSRHSVDLLSLAIGASLLVLNTGNLWNDVGTSLSELDHLRTRDGQT